VYKFVVYLYITCIFVYTNNDMNTDLYKKTQQSLKNLSPNLSAQDKVDAAKKFGVHKNTVLNYLKGEGPNVELGLKLIEYFNGVMDKKIKKVHKILAA
jgi:DNA-binding XRE family transcriptional regulator